jgi:hypothetical protein
MSDMKCPFCQQELEDANIHSSGLYFECPNCYDKQKEKDDNYTATPKVWQELIRTRNALDVAVDALKRLEKELYFNNAKQTGHIADSVMSIPSIALEQITKLEQKE